MKISYSDYHGPQGSYAVVNGKCVTADRIAIRALALNANLINYPWSNKVRGMGW